MLKVNNKSTRTTPLRSKLIIKTPERRHWSRSGIFIINFERVGVVLVSLSLTLNIFHTFF